MDEETRRFNFWTHQINIFFLRKLFPAHEHMRDVESKRLIVRDEKRVSIQYHVHILPMGGVPQRLRSSFSWT